MKIDHYVRKSPKSKIKKPKIRIFNDNSKNLFKIWEKNKLKEIDLCITSPPYWNQLDKNKLVKN